MPQHYFGPYQFPQGVSRQFMPDFSRLPPEWGGGQSRLPQRTAMSLQQGGGFEPPTGLPGWGGQQGGGQQGLRSLFGGQQPNAPWSPPAGYLGNPPAVGGSAVHTGPGIGIDALQAASNMGMFNPNYDPFMEQIRTQAFQDNAGRQNAARLGARLQGGGDPYLQAFAALQSQMQGQGDLSRLLGGAQLQRGLSREQFFQALLLQMIGGGQSYMQAGLGQPDPNAGVWPALGQLGGAAVGALGSPGGGGGGRSV